MWKCPVCEQESDGVCCAFCGFDTSRDYEHYPTIAPIPDGSLTVQKHVEEWESCLTCGVCAGSAFRFQKRAMQLVCLGCGERISLSEMIPGCTMPCEADDDRKRIIGICAGTDCTIVVAISAGAFHSVALRSDGTVYASGDNSEGQCNISHWTDIVAISAGAYHTVGLRSDGMLCTAGNNEDGQCDVAILMCGMEGIRK